MARINDIPFSDIYITPDKTAFINDRKTENGLAILRADDFDRFYEQLVKAWDGNNPSYSLLYDNIFIVSSEPLPSMAYNFAPAKCRKRFPSLPVLVFRTS